MLHCCEVLLGYGIITERRVLFFIDTDAINIAFKSRFDRVFRFTVTTNAF